MKWFLTIILGVAVFIVGVVIYLATTILKGLGSLYEPWTKH